MNRQVKRNVTGFIALLAGCIVNYLGDRLIALGGVEIELWRGLDTFTPLWMVGVFVVPLIAGIVVAMIFGLGGKWLCYFPPLIVRSINYVNFLHFTEPPFGTDVLYFPFWILFVILAVEAAAFGGVFGEIIVKRTYGRLPREMVYRSSKSDPDTGGKQ
jgi:hypothetical protein